LDKLILLSVVFIGRREADESSIVKSRKKLQVGEGEKASKDNSYNKERSAAEDNAGKYKDSLELNEPPSV
jgi:hypothetical protein